MTPSLPTHEPSAEELERVARVFKVAIWMIAAVVIGFSFFVGHHLLHERLGVEDPAAWILTPAVDLGLCAGLYASGVLNRFGISVGELNVLRWVCAAQTLVLNCAEPVLAHAWLSAGIHTFPAILLVLLTEADQSAQSRMLEKIAAARAVAQARLDAERAAVQARRDAEREAARVEAAERVAQVTAEAQQRAAEAAAEQARLEAERARFEAERAREKAAAAAKKGGTGTGTRAGSKTGIRTGTPGRDSTGTSATGTPAGTGAEPTLRDRMTAYANEALGRGDDLTGADLTREFGGDDSFGRKVLREVRLARQGMHEVPAEAAQ